MDNFDLETDTAGMDDERAPKASENVDTEYSGMLAIEVADDIAPLASESVDAAS